MNYQIQPFTYIKRATGMYAAMKAVKFMAMNPRLFQLSDPRRRDDSGIGFTPYVTQKTRFPIDIPYTLEQFDDKFKQVSSRRLRRFPKSISIPVDGPLPFTMRMP